MRTSKNILIEKEMEPVQLLIADCTSTQTLDLFQSSNLRIKNIIKSAWYYTFDRFFIGF